MVKLEKLLFLFFLFTLPTQLGKHFWPSFTTVLGIRIDYLSPTIYLTDIVFFLLFFSTGKLSLQIIKEILQNKLLLLFLLFVCISAIFSTIPPLAFYGILRIMMCALVVYYVRQRLHLHAPKSIRNTFLLTMLSQSALAVWQYNKQESIGGLWYFLGERTFTTFTPGIATISINGEKILRPYATFPHPNVLAGYMVVSFLLLIFFAMRAKTTWRYFVFVSVLAAPIVFLTFSRSALLTICINIALAFFILRKKLTRIGILCLLPILFFCLLVGFQLKNILHSDSFLTRVDLLVASLQIVKINPLLGVGILHFIPSLPKVISASSTVFFLQPVHNIYALLFSEIGIIGLSFAIYFFAIVLWKKTWFKSNMQIPLALAVVTVLIIGLFDHYFYTINQGQLLVSVLIGTVFASDRKDGKTV